VSCYGNICLEKFVLIVSKFVSVCFKERTRNVETKNKKDIILIICQITGMK